MPFPYPPSPMQYPPGHPNADPNALFERPKPAFCAFPDNGPNIFQQGFSAAGNAVVRWFGLVLSAVQSSFLGLGNVNMDMLRRDVLTEALWENSWSIIIGLACVVVMSLLAWFFAPKGENQTYVLVQTSSPIPLPLPAMQAARAPVPFRFRTFCLPVCSDAFPFDVGGKKVYAQFHSIDSYTIDGLFDKLTLFFFIVSGGVP